MLRRPPRSTLSSSSAASDVYKRQENYFDDEIELRGYKQYWYGAEKVPEIDQKNENIPTIIKPLPKETVFHGTVKFKNLSEDELGLLLWALQLDNGCYQGIGKGKPFGYGCVSVKIDSLSELDAGKLYGSSTLTDLSLIHISEPTRRTPISYAVFCLKKKKSKARRRSMGRGRE